MEILSSRTIIHPADLERSLAFYGEALGLAVAREFGGGDHRGVVFFAGGGLIEVVGQTGRPAGEVPVALWLQVRDATAAVADLGARGVAAARGPQIEPWGLIEAWVDDPDGIRIHLVEVPGDHPLRRDLRLR
jgi:catechol 2,3-dioxygenase-like lactoylglutathione lyase family enzyme